MAWSLACADFVLLLFSLHSAQCTLGSGLAIVLCGTLLKEEAVLYVPACNPHGFLQVEFGLTRVPSLSHVPLDLVVGPTIALVGPAVQQAPSGPWVATCAMISHRSAGITCFGVCRHGPFHNHPARNYVDSCRLASTDVDESRRRSTTGRAQVETVNQHLV